MSDSASEYQTAGTGVAKTLLGIATLILALGVAAVFFPSRVDENRTDIIHVPLGGCPRGYHIVLGAFEYQGAKLPACVSTAMKPGHATIDVLRAGESISVAGFAFPEFPPDEPGARHRSKL